MAELKFLEDAVAGDREEDRRPPARGEIAFLGPPAPPAAVEKEHLFDKMVTPSDVGKLNRLVIPKQHAERHFPLDPASDDKGLLLTFEDSGGKAWRFRYSYWNSSQSYVMTKGWSRFVKEKRLDAGDTVSFFRGVGEADARERLFIDWRRRVDDHVAQRVPPPLLMRSPWGAGRALLMPPGTMPATLYEHQYQHRQGSGYGMPPTNNPGMHQFFSPARTTGGTASRLLPPPVQPIRGVPAAGFPVVLDSTHPAAASTSKKRFRLFGVNVSCGESSSSSRAPDLRSSPSMPPSHARPPSPRESALAAESTSAAASTPASSPSSASTKKEANSSLDLDL